MPCPPLFADFKKVGIGFVRTLLSVRYETNYFFLSVVDVGWLVGKLRIAFWIVGGFDQYRGLCHHFCPLQKGGLVQELVILDIAGTRAHPRFCLIDLSLKRLAPTSLTTLKLDCICLCPNLQLPPYSFFKSYVVPRYVFTCRPF